MLGRFAFVQLRNQRIFSSNAIKALRPKTKYAGIIKRLRLFFGDNVSQFFLCLRAITGCDTTSALCNTGKPPALNVLINSPVFRETAAAFLAADTQEVIIKFGGDALVILFDGLTYETLDVLRFREF